VLRREQLPFPDLPGETAGVERRALLLLVVVVLDDVLGSDEHRFDRMREPALDGGRDQVASDEHDERGWQKSETDEDDDQLGLEFHPPHRTPSFDEELDQVPPEDEHQDQQHRQVHQGEPIEEDPGEEVGLELRRLSHEVGAEKGHPRQQENDEGDEAKVVLRLPELGGAGGSGHRSEIEGLEGT
jgi:hypothetical protein